MHIQLPLPRRRGATAVLAAALIMMGGAGALASPAAHADQNTGIAVELEPLVLSDHDGNDIPDEPAHLEDPVRMRFSWDATGADPQPDESFTIALPSEYRFREIGRKDGLVLDDGTRVGECTTASDVLTCTFGTGIAAASQLRGSGHQLIIAQETTATSSTSFDANGTAVPVLHPNRDRILPIAWEEKDLGAYANTLDRDSSALTWHIQFSGTTIANHLGAQDGTVSTVTFKDITADGQRLDPDTGSWYVRVNPEQYGGGADGYFEVARGDGTAVSTEHGSFTLTPTIGSNATSASVTLTRTDGALDPSTNYEIVYQSLAEGGRIIPGRVYTSSATLAGGAGTTVRSQASYRDPISYDVELTRDLGAFTVIKRVEGDNRQAFSQELFRIHYACGTRYEGSLDVRGDGTPVSGPSLPVGTRCTITEAAEQSDNGAQRPGYSVRTTIDKGELTIGRSSAGATEVTITNTYTEIPVIPVIPEIPALPAPPDPAPTTGPTPGPVPSTAGLPTPAASTPPAQEDGVLASTGANAGATLGLGAGALAAGALLLRTRRR